MRTQQPFCPNVGAWLITRIPSVTRDYKVFGRKVDDGHQASGEAISTALGIHMT